LERNHLGKREVLEIKFQKEATTESQRKMKSHIKKKKFQESSLKKEGKGNQG